jgi:hypothetical protein
MNAENIAREFVKVFNQGNYDSINGFLEDGFQFSGATPEPMNGAQWIGMSRTLRSAFPDINYRMRVESSDGATVRVSTQLSGTHSAPLDLTKMGMGVIEATGKAFSLPQEFSSATVTEGKLSQLQMEPSENGGLKGILGQLGVT